MGLSRASVLCIAMAAFWLGSLGLPTIARAQDDGRLVVMNFRGSRANRVKRDVIDTLVRQSGLSTQQVVRLPAGRSIDSIEASEVRDLLAPEGVRGLLMGELSWTSFQPRSLQLRLVLWTARGRRIELETRVLENARLSRSSRAAIRSRLVPALNEAFAEPQATREPTESPPTDGDPPPDTAGTPTSSDEAPAATEVLREIQALRSEVQALRERQERLEDGVDGGGLTAESRPTADFSGGFAFLYQWLSFDDTTRAAFGRVLPVFFSIKFRGGYDRLQVQAEYRLASTALHGIRQAWAGLRLVDGVDVRVGILPVHFGIMPYVSNQFVLSPLWFFGLENQVELGAMLNVARGPFVLNFGFYKTTELGGSVSENRFSFDLHRADLDDDGVLDQDNEQLNQFSLWTTYTIEHGDVGSTEIGLSGRFGFLYNHTTQENGHQWAAALHVRGQWGPVELRVEGGRYDIRPKNPDGISNDWILIGGMGMVVPTAARGYFLTSNVSVTIPLARAPFDSMVCYAEYTSVWKDLSNQETTQRIAPGCHVIAGPMHLYLDAPIARNNFFFGGNPDSHAAGGDAEWSVTAQFVFAYLF